VARLARVASVLATLTITSALLASCGNSGAIADVRYSCVYVKRALKIELQSEQSNISSSRRRTLQANALSELLKATPSAAAATSIDGSWNPLMTTINEAERVPMPHLVDSLTRLCKVADSPNPYL
jgi:hypothetical protein